MKNNKDTLEKVARWNFFASILVGVIFGLLISYAFTLYTGGDTLMAGIVASVGAFTVWATGTFAGALYASAKHAHGEEA